MDAKIFLITHHLPYLFFSVPSETLFLRQLAPVGATGATGALRQLRQWVAPVAPVAPVDADF